VNHKARQELVGIGALVVGLFLGLTLLRLPITGSWGDRIGSLLWRAFGAGSVLVPVLGIGWALAAFDRLGSLSAARAAALGAGLVLLLPYGIGTVTGARFPVDYRLWGPTQQLVGVLPAALAHGVHQTVGTAGGVLVGVFALSALAAFTRIAIVSSGASKNPELADLLPWLPPVAWGVAAMLLALFVAHNLAYLVGQRHATRGAAGSG